MEKGIDHEEKKHSMASTPIHRSSTTHFQPARTFRGRSRRGIAHNTFLVPVIALRLSCGSIVQYGWRK